MSERLLIFRLKLHILLLELRVLFLQFSNLSLKVTNSALKVMRRAKQVLRAAKGPAQIHKGIEVAGEAHNSPTLFILSDEASAEKFSRERLANLTSEEATK
jgi:hypothetical protein